MSELFLNYRDITLPNPLWEEQGVYGGYRWLELSESVWISRKWEPYMVTYQELKSGTMKLSCSLQCMRDFKDMLSDSSVLIEHMPSYKQGEVSSARELVSLARKKKYVQDCICPTEVQRDNWSKIRALCKRQGAVAMVGYNARVDELIQSLGISEVYSNSSMLGGELSEEAVVGLTSRIKVIIPHEKYYLKQHVCNWANVITI